MVIKYLRYQRSLFPHHEAVNFRAKWSFNCEERHGRLELESNKIAGEAFLGLFVLVVMVGTARTVGKKGSRSS